MCFALYIKSVFMSNNNFQIDLFNYLFQIQSNSIKPKLTNDQINIINKSPQLPNLNFIEYIWSQIKIRLNEYYTPSNGLLQL